MATFIKKKDPYQFWNFRDVRKLKIKPPEVPDLPLFQQHSPGTFEAIRTHHILLPLENLPELLCARIKADLTLMNPEFQKAAKYGKGFVSYAIPEFVRLYAADSKYLGLPRSTKMSYLHKQFGKFGLKLKIKDIRPKFEDITFPEKGDMKPFFYQVEGIKQILGGDIVLKFKCGKGKTAMALMAVANLRLKTLILVRTNILLNQWVEAIHKIFKVPEEEVGIINGMHKREGLITVATEQSLAAMSRKDKRRIGNNYGHLIVDECHSVGAAQYHELMTYFKARKVTGLSATPFREDGMDPVLKLYIGPIVEVDDLGEFETKVRIRKTKFKHGFIGKKDKYHHLLKTLIKDEARNKLIIGDVIEYAEKGKVLVVYSNRIEHMETLQKMLKKQAPQIPSAILASKIKGKKQSSAEQEDIKKKLKNSEIRVLFGGKIVEEGFDCPPLSVALLSTPTKSRRLIEQVLGRCQREFPGKKEAILVDYVDEGVKILLYQFFSKLRRFYKNYIQIRDLS